MTSSGPRDPRQAAADYIAGLARNSSMSQRRILAAARAIGLRISNNIGRAVINAVRGAVTTPGQTASILNLDQSSLRGALAGVRRQVEQIVTRRLKQQQERARVRITYRVGADVGWLWENVRPDPRTTRAVIETTVTIRSDQETSFFKNLQRLARSHEQALLDRGLRQLNIRSRSGSARFESAPEVTIVRRQHLGERGVTVNFTGFRRS